MRLSGKAFPLAVLPVLLLTPPLLWLGKHFESQLAYEQRTRTQSTLELHADAVQQAFGRIESKLEGLATFVTNLTAGGKELDSGRFETFAAGLHAGAGWVRAFQVVTDGVITHTYPLKGNEAVLGYNLLGDPRPILGGDVLRALQTGRVTITGPITLVQGGLGIIIRKPLTSTNGSPARLVAIVLNIAPLLAESGIREQDTHAVRIAVRGGNREVFFGEPAVFEQHPVTRRLGLPDGGWEIGACPVEGWQAATSRPVLLFYSAGGTIILLLGFLVFALARRQANLTEMVQSRTEALQAELAARQQAQEQLRQNLVLLQAVTEGTSDAVFAKDLHGCYRMINSAGARFLGRTRDAIIGKTDRELFTDETAQDIIASDLEVIASGLVRTFEERGTAAGVSRVYQATKAPWHDPDGRVIGVVGVSRDITERKQTELALRESEERLRLALDAARMGTFDWDMPRNRVVWSHWHEELWGYASGEFDGTYEAFARRVHPEDLPVLVAEQARCQAECKPFVTEVRVVWPDGSVHWMASTGRYEYGPDGRPIRMRGTVREITARKRAEEGLRQSEEQFRLIMENLADLVAVLDVQGHRLYNSPSYQKLLGAPDKLLGTSSFAQVHPEDRARVQQAFEETVRIGIGQRLQYRLVDQHGQARYIESQGSVIRDSRGQVSRVVVVSRDVTERQRTEETLRESESRYRFLFEHNPMPMLIYERGTLQMLAVNEAFVEHYGYSFEEALAMRLTDLYPEEEKAKIAGLIPQLRGHANVGEWHHRKRDGTFLTIVACSHDLSYTGRSARVAVLTDITERKQAEEALRQSEEQFRSIMENLADLVAVLDLEGRRLYSSPSFAPILGEPAKLHGLSAFDHVHPEDRERVRQVFDKIVRTGLGGRVEGRLVGIDGQARMIEAQGSAIRDAHGRVCRVVIVSRDVTERRHAEEAIRELNVTLERRVAKRTAELAVAKERAESADRLKSAFLATMSHELRTPLNSIIGFTGIMLQGLAGPLNPEQTKQLGMVRGSARHLLALINDVLDISKIEAGQLEVRADPFDLRASLVKVAGLVKPLAEKKGLALSTDLSPEVGQITGDRVRVEQVLLNLLNNAVKFTEHGEVALVAEAVAEFKSRRHRVAQPAVRLRVVDTGIGIKPEDMAKLFQPFRQIDTGLTRQHEGTGLGLAICRRLADMLGGEIHVKSVWGKGSTFTFVVPVNCILNHETNRLVD